MNTIIQYCQDSLPNLKVRFDSRMTLVSKQQAQKYYTQVLISLPTSLYRWNPVSTEVPYTSFNKTWRCPTCLNRKQSYEADQTLKMQLPGTHLCKLLETVMINKNTFLKHRVRTTNKAFQFQVILTFQSLIKAFIPVTSSEATIKYGSRSKGSNLDNKPRRCSLPEKSKTDP